MWGSHEWVGWCWTPVLVANLENSLVPLWLLLPWSQAWLLGCGLKAQLLYIDIIWIFHGYYMDMCIYIYIYVYVYVYTYIYIYVYIQIEISNNPQKDRTSNSAIHRYLSKMLNKMRHFPIFFLVSIQRLQWTFSRCLIVTLSRWFFSLDGCGDVLRVPELLVEMEEGQPVQLTREYTWITCCIVLLS